MAKTIKKYWRWWRRNGAPIIAITMIPAMIISPFVLAGLMFATMTIPCGDKRINNNRKLWIMRQAYFAVIGMTMIILGLILKHNASK